MMSPGSALSIDPAQQLDGVPLQHFSHDAMACTFELFIAGVEHTYAEQVSWVAFDEVDRLERELSRFIPSSDVGRINALEPGESMRVSMATMECLQLASEVYRETAGAFDVTVGALLDERRDAQGLIQAPDAAELAQRPESGMELLNINGDDYTVGRRAEGAMIDLGAIGKGYALDHIAKILHEWSIPAALIHSGQSTVLALGSPDGEQPWSVVLRDPQQEANMLGEVYLYDRALSGSGMRLHGQHIIDPRTGDAARGKLATWAIADSAARSDALSTAFMVMAPEEVEQYCNTHAGVVGLILLEEAGQPTLLSYGEFAQLDPPAIDSSANEEDV